MINQCKEPSSYGGNRHEGKNWNSSLVGQRKLCWELGWKQRGSSSLQLCSFTVNTYSLFQSTFFSHGAASKRDTNQFLLSPVSVIQTAEIFVIHQNQGEYLAVKRLPCRDLTPAASKYIIEKEAESLTPSGLYSLQTCAFACWSCPSRFVDNSLWDIDTESMIT